MLAGAPYAGAPYAGTAMGAAAGGPIEVVDGGFSGAALFVVAWLEVAETAAAVVLPEANVHRYDVVRVLPTPTLVDGRPT